MPREISPHYYLVEPQLADRVRRLEKQVATLTEITEVLTRGRETSPNAEPGGDDAAYAAYAAYAAKLTHELLLRTSSPHD